MSTSKHPEVLWAQRSSETDNEKNVLFVTINLPDIVESTLQYDLQPTGLSFKAQAGTVVSSTYEFKIDLYKEVIPEESGKRLTSRSLVLNLRKKDLELEYWPRLTKEKIRNTYIKTDFSKWVDEDEQDGAKVNFDEEDVGGGGGGGMPGFGGGGMPGFGGGGMPGLGGGGMPGFGGGDMGFDMEKMMASMGRSDTDEPGPTADEDLGSDDSDDAGPPPLEPSAQ